jgi:hypothetical protein
MITVFGKRECVPETLKGLWGPFSLTPRGIDAAVSDSSPGVYVLGKKNGHDLFRVRYVGRDDQDIKGCLKKHVADWYPLFFYRYYFSAKDAFDKECELYHDFNPPDNQAHPARSENANWTCPRCALYD